MPRPARLLDGLVQTLESEEMNCDFRVKLAFFVGLARLAGRGNLRPAMTGVAESPEAAILAATMRAAVTCITCGELDRQG
jgi:hypothetical protein